MCPWGVNETVKVGKGRKEQVVWVWGVVMVRQPREEEEEEGRRADGEERRGFFIHSLPALGHSKPPCLLQDTSLPILAEVGR
jgi:hypothetical protein